VNQEDSGQNEVDGMKKGAIPHLVRNLPNIGRIGKLMIPRIHAISRQSIFTTVVAGTRLF